MAATMAFPQSAAAESPTSYNRKSYVRSIVPTFSPVLFPALDAQTDIGRPQRKVTQFRQPRHETPWKGFWYTPV
jgi:hypothetical protein